MSSQEQLAVDDAIAAAHRIMADNSKSFSLAAKGFDRETRNAAAVLYAYCRYVDDCIDNVNEQSEQLLALERLELELVQVYREDANLPPVLAQLSTVVKAYNIPQFYFDELLRGMGMDVGGRRYSSLAELIDYCYCVAATVGLMMAHIMRIRGNDDQAVLTAAAQLGIAMQLTNICRDVEQDRGIGRVYMPHQLLLGSGVDPGAMSTAPLPALARACQPVVANTLAVANQFYRAGMKGARHLPWRASFAVRAAARIYRAIGKELQRSNYSIAAPRAVVPRWRKRMYLMIAGLGAIAEIPARLFAAVRGHQFHSPVKTITSGEVLSNSKQLLEYAPAVLKQGALVDA